MIRVKDNKFVASALDGILEQTLEQARSKGLEITTVVHKVCRIVTFVYLTIAPTDGPSILTVLEQWNVARPSETRSQVPSDHPAHN